MRAFILWLFWWCMPRGAAGNDVPHCGPAFIPTCQSNNGPAPQGGLAQKNMSQGHRLRLHTVAQDRPSASLSLLMSTHTVGSYSWLARNWC